MVGHCFFENWYQFNLYKLHSLTTVKKFKRDNDIGVTGYITCFFFLSVISGVKSTFITIFFKHFSGGSAVKMKNPSGNGFPE